MTNRIPSYLTLGALVLACGVSDVFAVGKLGYTLQRKDEKAGTAGQIQNFALPKHELASRQLMVNEDEAMNNPANVISNSTSLGVINPTGRAASGPGFSLRSTYEDWQYSHKGRKVGFSEDAATSVEVHFGFSDMSSTTLATDQYAYRRFDPVSGTFPLGTALCSPQNSGERGLWPNMAVNPEGYAVLYGSDNAGAAIDNAGYYSTSPGCFWGPGKVQILPAQYRINMTGTTAVANHPQIEVQIVGADTVTHLLLHSSNFTDYSGAGNGMTVIQYFRKGAPWGNAGAWAGPTTLDSAFYRATLASSRVSDKVAAVYAQETATAVPNQNLDLDIVYRQSTDGGLTWAAPVNITNYNRTVASYAPWIETHAMYTSTDNLSILWNGNPWPEDVYDSAGFFFGDFSASLFHWNSSTSTISRVANADYGLPFNTQVCGFMGSNALYIAFFNISECDGNLYSFWTQAHTINNKANPADTVNNIYDDCASSPGAQGSRVFQANGNIFMSVSSDLSGLLWDAPRAISSTYTPGCDSATGGGVCMHETKGSVATFGQVDAGYIWPTGSLVDPDGGAAGTNFLHMMYLEDHYPGAVLNTTPTVTLNDMRWARIACVDPVAAALISASPLSIGYPEWRNHGDDDTVTVTITNDGNVPLNITTIAEVQTSGPSGWLDATSSSLTVPAGVGNTGTVNILINKNGIVNSAGTVVSLNGYVYFLSNAVNNDSVVFLVQNYIIADTVVGIVWDTVNTGTGTVAATGRVSLVVGSHGNLGRGGLGRVNLDYAQNGIANECDTLQTVYLYSGGPIVLKSTGGVAPFSFSSSAFAADFADTVTFKPIDGIAPSSSSNASFEVVNSGIFVNEDSTIGVKQSVYAPKKGADSADFVVVCTKFFARSANVPNVMIGDLIDWDIPADVGATNKAGVEGSTVFMRGTDTGALTACNKRTRYGANTFLGMYTQTQFAGNNCFNDAARYGQYAARNDSDVFTADNGVLDPAKTWTKAGALNGAVAITDSADMHIVTTYKYNVTLTVGDTVTVYTALTTVRDGAQTDLAANILAAQIWYDDNLRNDCGIYSASCCVGTTGNVDGVGNVDIADLTFLVDHLFITNPPVPCADEANVDGIGNVDIADLTFLVDHLFITNPPLPACS